MDVSGYILWKGHPFHGNKKQLSNELAVEKNKLLSTKEEKGHGIGLANVRKMVEKYQGFMDVSNTNQIFIVKVMLYL